MDAFGRTDETLTALEAELETMYQQGTPYAAILAKQTEIAERVNALSLARSEMWITGSWDRKAA